jgi:hypothetical protein
LADGIISVSEFANNRENGHGTYTFPDGRRYVGYFKDGKKEGQGTFIWPNGEKYVGEWKSNEKNGKGVYTWPDKSKYVGEFKGDERDGQGTHTFSDGREYVGTFKNGGRNGQGTFTWPNGEKYVGEFRDDKINGQGTFTLSDGGKYIGDFSDFNADGQGTRFYPDGSKFIGQYKDNKKNGRGVLYAADGSIKDQGIWKDDILVAPDNPPRGKRVALVIGNSKYQFETYLPNPVNDANLITESLKAVGFDSVKLELDLPREKMVAKIREFATQADSADWALIYYSGHGIEFKGLNYLLPVDAKLSFDRDIPLIAIDMENMMESLNGAKKLKMLILDSCRSNPFVAGMRQTLAVRSVGKGLAPVEPNSGTMVIYAAKHGQEALDGEGKNSPFAEALAKRILMPNIEIRRLVDFIRDDVVAATSKKQEPFHYGSPPSSEEFFFNKK